MKSDKILEQLETKILSKAIENLDIDAIADELSVQLADKLQHGINWILEERLDLGGWIEEELTNSDTKAGKSFAKAVEKIAERMAKSV